ncbi:MAG: hypothetical protein KL839_10660 [Rhizobium sp.]|nr:hypothetical protein [Rhizobium sp.]
MAFLEDRAPLRSRMLRAAVICVLCFYLACFLFDLWLLGDVTFLSAVLRFGVILPIAIALFFYINGRHPIERKENAAILVALLANISWCVILVSSSSPGVLTYYYSAATFQMAITIAAASPFRPALRARPLHLLPQLLGHLVPGGLVARLCDPAPGRLHADRDHDALRLLPARSGGDEQPSADAGKRGAETGIVAPEQGPSPGSPSPTR